MTEEKNPIYTGTPGYKMLKTVEINDGHISNAYAASLEEELNFGTYWLVRTGCLSMDRGGFALTDRGKEVIDKAIDRPLE